ncbi:MAG: molybdopterin molybdotransferase MoeA [Luteolibacter sp.]
MLSFREALDLLLKNTPPLAVERCRLEETAGRVLREPVTADRPFPAFDRVMMDGFALKSADWQAGQRFFQLTDSAPAGKPQVRMAEERGTCVEVMTGAPCPLGADLIVPVEEVISNQAGVVRFSEHHERVPGKFIHRTGSDALAGQLLLESGCLLGSREIGVAASCGKAFLEVSKKPEIAVIATGDELVGVDQTPAAHQIRQSNGYSLAAALERAGYPPADVGVLGDEISIAGPTLEKLLATHDWLILTGAVSQGARDFVPSLLVELGCKLVFHGVAQRPGKPAGCWIGPKGQVIMALPGNPVSALTGLHAFVIPALAVASGLPLPSLRRVILEDRLASLPDFTRHLPVTLRADGRAEAAVTGNSGDFIGLLKSEGFLTLPPRGDEATAFPFTPWY